MKTIFAFFAMLVLCSSNLWCQSEQWNLDFEEWDLNDFTAHLWHDTTIVENRNPLFPPHWHNRSDHIDEGTGLGRTTDATEGNYAVALSGFYAYEVMRIISGSDARRPGWPIDFRPSKLTGDYKTILLGECDSLKVYVDVYLTKYNNSNDVRDTIGLSKLVLGEVMDYTNFELNIDYSDHSAEMPDTVIIVLAKERFGFDVPPACLECSHVFFDRLVLEPATTNNIENSLVEGMMLYPNPAHHELFIQSECEPCTFKVSLMNRNGQIIQNYTSVTGRIKLENMDIGLYYARIENDITGVVKYEKLLVH